MEKKVKVVAKFRPILKRERDQSLEIQWRVRNDTIECLNTRYPDVKYTFDKVYDADSSTEDLFEGIAKPIVESAINGYNGTVFAYGQTSSGKTYTMIGESNKPGIIILAARQIFDITSQSERSYLLRVSYVEIYNEIIHDLLDGHNELKIRENEKKDGIILQCKEEVVNNVQAIMEKLKLGNVERKTANTKMNARSSRSHAIFSIIIESVGTEAVAQQSVLNFVDLAGSEKPDSASETSQQRLEGSSINKSLLSLSLVINNLSQNSVGFINYRDSNLTRILQASLGGNALTAIVCTVTAFTFGETRNTLEFGKRAKKIQNKARVNQIRDAVIINRIRCSNGADGFGIKELELEDLKQLVAQQSAEIAYLRQELEAEKLRSSQLSGILAAMDENNNEAGPSSLHAGPSSPQAGPSSLHARPSPLHASPLSDSNDTEDLPLNREPLKLLQGKHKNSWKLEVKGFHFYKQTIEIGDTFYWYCKKSRAPTSCPARVHTHRRDYILQEFEEHNHLNPEEEKLVKKTKKI